MEKITKIDVNFLKNKNKTLKLIAKGVKNKKRDCTVVEPTILCVDDDLFDVKDAYNELSVYGENF